MTDAPELLLAHHLKTLRLPVLLREHDKQARICSADRAGVDRPGTAHGRTPDQIGKVPRR